MVPFTLSIILICAVGFTLFVYFTTKSDNLEESEVFEEIRNPQVLQILVPRENDKTPLAAEQMFASIHGILRESTKSLDMLSFEIASNFDEGIRFYIVVPQHIVKFVEGQVYAQYPNADIQHVKDYTQIQKQVYFPNGEPAQSFITTGEIELSKDYIFPIKTFRNFEVDPLAAVTGAMSDLSGGEEAWIQLLVRPVANYWQQTSKEYITAIKDGKDPSGDGSLLNKFFSDLGKTLSTISLAPTDAKATPAKEVVKLAPGQDEELRQIEEKMLKPGFEIAIRVITKATDQYLSEQLLKDIVASFKQFTTSHLNSFEPSVDQDGGEVVYDRYVRRFLDAAPLDIVNIEELASVYHLPNVSVETPNIMWSRARKAEPPLNLPVVGGSDEDVTLFAETDYRGARVSFGLKRADRRRHMYLLGKTGVGKSSTFKNMFISDVLHGDGACYIDPHGPDIEELMNYIPPNRVKDVIYFDPSDTENPIGFNLLELGDPMQRDLVADGVVSVFKKEFGTSWGPRLQYLLQNAVATCLEAQGTTILAVQRILVDTNYRKFILKQVKDPILLKFWEDEFAQMAQNSKLITEAVAPIQNKIGRFISSAIIRNIVGQTKSTINLREIMDQRKILMINLSQGKIGEENASLLGGMIITRLQSAAMERVDVPEDERKDFFLFVDEFQNFATDSFAKILSEARKFRLNLVMTNQYIEQIPLTVRHSIFGNVGSLSSFVVSQSDAQILANEMAPIFSAEDLVSLESHSMYVKLAIDGMTSKPFSAKSLNYKDRLQKYNLQDEVRAMSRQQYGTERAVIEDKIMRWAMQSYSDKGNRSTNNSGKNQGNDKKQGSNKKSQSEVSNKSQSNSKAQNNKGNKDNSQNKQNSAAKANDSVNESVTQLPIVENINNSESFAGSVPHVEGITQTQKQLDETVVYPVDPSLVSDQALQSFDQPGVAFVSEEPLSNPNWVENNPDQTDVTPLNDEISGDTPSGYAEVDYEAPVISPDQQVYGQPFTVVSEPTIVPDFGNDQTDTNILNEPSSPEPQDGQGW